MMKLIYRSLDEELIQIDYRWLFSCVLLVLIYFYLVFDFLSDYSTTYLEEGESHFISFPLTYTTRLYNARILQTNATNGFRVVFRDLFLNDGVQVQLGTGNDPSDIQAGIITIHGNINDEPDDVFVDTKEMWFAVIGSNGDSRLRMDVEIISIDLSSECWIIFFL